MAEQSDPQQRALNVAVVGICPDNVHYQTYVRQLLQCGHDVTVITDAATMDAPVKVISYGRHTRLIRYVPKGFGVLVRVSRVWRALRRGHYDVVSIQQMTPDGVYAALLSKAPVVPTFWGSDLLRLEIRPWFVRKLMPFAVRRATVLHATCEEIAERLAEMGGRAQDIETFNYGIDLEVFSADGPEIRDPHRIVCTRGLRPFYRTSELISALPGLVERYPDIRLVLAGDGQPGDREALEALADSLGVRAHVEFPGRLTPTEVAAQLRRAAVWASLPPSDSFALSLQEAMACGAFPVTSDLRAMREGIDESRGILLAEITPVTVSAALAMGIERAATGAHIVENRAVVEAKGDRRVNLARFEGLILRAAGVHRGDSRA